MGHSGGVAGVPHHLKYMAFAFIILGIVLDILQQVSSGYLLSWSSSVWGGRLHLAPPTTTPIRCDAADHQFLVQKAIPDDECQLKLVSFPASLDPLGSCSKLSEQWSYPRAKLSFVRTYCSRTFTASSTDKHTFYRQYISCKRTNQTIFIMRLEWMKHAVLTTHCNQISMLAWP